MLFQIFFINFIRAILIQLKENLDILAPMGYNECSMNNLTGGKTCFQASFHGSARLFTATY